MALGDWGCIDHVYLLWARTIVCSHCSAAQHLISAPIVGRQAQISLVIDSKLKSGSIAASCHNTHASSGLPHRRSLIIDANVPPASIHAAAHDIARRASEVHAFAVGARAIN